MRLWELASSAYSPVDNRSRAFLENSFSLDVLSGSFKDTVLSTLGKIKKTNSYLNTLHTLRKSRYLDGANEVRQYSILEQFQFANSTMEPYLVAMPEYRKLYNNNRAAGYEDSFSKYDRFRGNAHMHTDSNYREITSGLSNEYDKDYVMSWDLDENSKVTNVDRIDVAICWNRLRGMDWEDSDPMSQYGASAE